MFVRITKHMFTVSAEINRNIAETNIFTKYIDYSIRDSYKLRKKNLF